MSEDTRTLAIAGLIVLLLALLIATPLALIWALNTLFRLGIETTWGTYFAALFVLLVLGGRYARSRSES